MENHKIWHRYVAYVYQATTNNYIDYCLWLNILTIGMFIKKIEKENLFKMINFGLSDLYFVKQKHKSELGTS